jgi:polysaccharide pyruvyl transferase WcaK-like protein
MSQNQIHLGIIGASFSGNRGAEAMLRTVIDVVREQHPEAVFHILTYAPIEDLNEALPENCFLENATPWKLISTWFIAGLAFPLNKRAALSGENQHFMGICRMLNLDGIIDIFGVSFMDSRLKFIPFNVLSLWPFLRSKVPIYKLSQAMGPFEKWQNRIPAAFVFNRLRLIVARGSTTAKLLSKFSKIKSKVITAPDIAFLFNKDDNDPSVSWKDRPTDVALIPSSIVAKKSPHYYTELIALARELIHAGHTVKIICHAWKHGVDQGRNNDFSLCQKLYSDLNSPKVELIAKGALAKDLKQAIASCKVCLTSRFHGMISALSTATPVYVIGWSHKYHEVLEQFECVDCAIPHKQFSSKSSFQTLNNWLNVDGEKISQGLASKVPLIQKQALENFSVLFEDLSKENA